MSAPRVHGWFHPQRPQKRRIPVCPACAWVVPFIRVRPSKRPRLPRVCMGGSVTGQEERSPDRSAPRVHGWFLAAVLRLFRSRVCPACAWVVPMDADPRPHPAGLPRVCMGGSRPKNGKNRVKTSAPRVHGWFQPTNRRTRVQRVCPACAWVVPIPPLWIVLYLCLPRVCMGGSKSHDHPGGFAFVLRHPTPTPSRYPHATK